MGVDIDIVLTAFTVLAPAGAVAYVLINAILLVSQPADDECQRLTRWLVFPILACLIGLIASATHLGTPANALYTLLGFGRSPLSNEIVAAVTFAALSWMHWLVSFAVRLPQVPDRLWRLAASIAGLWLVSRIAMVYSVPTIPTWNLPWTPWALWLVSLTTGPILCLATTVFARIHMRREWTWSLIVLAGVALIGSVVILALEGEDLSRLRNSYGTAIELVPMYGWYVAGYALFVGTGIALAALEAHRQPSAKATREGNEAGGRTGCPTRLAAASRARWLTSLALVFVGAALARIPFYAMHMTVGL